MTAVFAVAGLALLGTACGTDEPESSASSGSSANGAPGTPDSPESNDSGDSSGSTGPDSSGDSGDSGGSKQRSDDGTAGGGTDGKPGRTSTPVPDDPDADPEDGVVLRPRSGTSCAEVAKRPAGEFDGQCTTAGDTSGKAYSVDCTDGRQLWFVGDGARSYFGFEGKRYQEWDNESNYAGYERAMNSCES